MSVLALVVPALAGMLVGVNPFTAPLLRARLDERDDQTLDRVLAEAVGVTVVVGGLVGAATYAFSRFVSGRLSNGLLILGLFALLGGAYALKPVGRDRGEDRPPRGGRWIARYAGDAAYFLGPAWLVATAYAMRGVTTADYVLPFVAATAGAAVATALGVLVGGRRLPASRPRPHAPVTRAGRALAAAYVVAALLVLAQSRGFP